MYRCMAIDDEPLALQVLAGYIKKRPDLHLVDLLTDPLTGLERALNGEADLVFLDIEMPGMNGIEFMQKIGDRCKVILTTAYPEFAMEGYEYSVIDYLLKPISVDRFNRAVDKLPVHHSTAQVPDYIFIKVEYKLVRVNLAEVRHLESLRDYVALHLDNGQRLLTLQTLGSLEKELPASKFSRIHKSYIVSHSKVTSIGKDRLTLGNLELPIGKTYKGKLISSLQAD